MSTLRTSLVVLALVSCVAWDDALSGGDDVDSCFPRLDVELVSATPFQLSRPYQSPWRHDRPPVSTGFVVVMRTDGDLIRPHATPDPNLFAGDEVVEIVFRDPDAGIVAGVIRERKTLAGLELFWGSPRYASEITMGQVASERSRAASAGLKPVPDARVHRSLALSPATKTFVDRGALYDFATEMGKSAAF